MSQKTKSTLFLMVIAMALLGVAMGCSKAGGDKGTKARVLKTADSEQIKKMAADSTYNSLMIAKALYVCPMHSEFVSADPNAKCSICAMNTEKMSDEKVAEFRAKLKKP